MYAFAFIAALLVVVGLLTKPEGLCTAAGLGVGIGDVYACASYNYKD